MTAQPSIYSVPSSASDVSPNRFLPERGEKVSDSREKSFFPWVHFTFHDERRIFHVERHTFHDERRTFRVVKYKIELGLGTFMSRSENFYNGIGELFLSVSENIYALGREA